MQKVGLATSAAGAAAPLLTQPKVPSLGGQPGAPMLDQGAMAENLRRRRAMISAGRRGNILGGSNPAAGRATGQQKTLLGQ